MSAKPTRINREKETVQAMIRIYCRRQHGFPELCPDCRELLDYAVQRLDGCKFGEKKTACGDCPVHCYKKDMREKIIGIMRYSGPRMIFSHPVMAIQHVFDKLHKPKK